jgi:hypothetical protein
MSPADEAEPRTAAQPEQPTELRDDELEGVDGGLWSPTPDAPSAPQIQGANII